LKELLDGKIDFDNYDMRKIRTWHFEKQATV